MPTRSSGSIRPAIAIHLTTDSVGNAPAHSTSINGGLDTLITLSDGSTSLLKFVSRVDGSFFSSGSRVGNACAIKGWPCRVANCHSRFAPPG